jgi:predicted  nucleic acid-binding Zn-ribbon protein
MSDPQIEKLLIVQTCDIKLQKTELDLSRLPKERAAYQSKIESERASIEDARQALAALEVSRKELDSQSKSLEAEIQRFRNQQLEVKKNEEYRALTAQIEQAEATISDLEEKEIELMFEIDAAKEAFEKEKLQIEGRIGEQEKLISLLTEKEQTLSQSLETARQEYASARTDVDAEYLDQYDRVRKLVKRAPYLAAIVSQKCGGCHLRVSNEVSHAAGSGGEPHFCDQCARMVYILK